MIGVGGLAQDGTITLDATGNGSFTVASLGTAPPGLDIHIESSYNPRFRTKIRAVSKWLWNAVSDCAISFVGGDPQTTAGTVASIAGGILIVGDIGSVCKNLWRMTAFSDTPPNYVEMALGGLGIATSGLVITGVGAAVHVAIAPLKTLAIRLGSEGARMITVYVDLIRRTIATSGDQFTWAHLAVVNTMVGDAAVGTAYSSIKHTDDLVNGTARGGSRFGSAANAYHQANKRAAANHGSKVAANLINVLGGIGEAALTTLKALPTSQLDEALDGLARVLSKGVNPQVMRRVLDNHHVYGTAYTRVQLLKDLDILADVPGMPDIARMLQVNHPNVKGFRYEVEGAAYLSRTNLEEPVTSLTQRVSVIWDDLEIDTFGEEMIKKFGKKTDIDVITGNPPTHIFRQLKSTAGSMKSLTKVKAWCEKARKARENPIGNYNGLIFHLPEDEIPKITKPVKDWLDSKNIQILPIIMAP